MSQQILPNCFWNSLICLPKVRSRRGKLLKKIIQEFVIAVLRILWQFVLAHCGSLHITAPFFLLIVATFAHNGNFCIMAVSFCALLRIIFAHCPPPRVWRRWLPLPLLGATHVLTHTLTASQTASPKAIGLPTQEQSSSDICQTF